MSLIKGLDSKCNDLLALVHDQISLKQFRHLHLEVSDDSGSPDMVTLSDGDSSSSAHAPAMTQISAGQGLVDVRQPFDVSFIVI